MWLDFAGEMLTCLVLTPLPPLLHLFVQPMEHLVMKGQLVWESLGASSFYEILVSLWVSWVVVLCLPLVYSFVNRPHVADKQLDPLIGVE